MFNFEHLDRLLNTLETVNMHLLKINFQQAKCMQKLVQTNRFPSYPPQIIPKTYKTGAFQCWLDWSSIYNMQKLSGNLEGKSINMFIVHLQKKNTISPNLNTGSSRMLCHFLQFLMFRIGYKRTRGSGHLKFTPFGNEIHVRVGEHGSASMPAFICRPLCVYLCAGMNGRGKHASAKNKKQWQTPPLTFLSISTWHWVLWHKWWPRELLQII